MQKGELTEVVAIASRTMDRARQAADRLGVSRAYGSYEALLDDPEVDAVYVPLPNDQHVSWSIRALEAGKHVLCEKPLGLSAAQARELAAAGARYPKLRLMEAFMYRHHPQWRKAKQWVDTRQIGRVRSVQTFFSFFNVDPANVRHDPAMGGGSLMDVGCYAISVARWMFGSEPRRVVGLLEEDSRFHVDRLTSALLEFDTGMAAFTCSMQVAPLQQVQIVGDEGRIEVADIPFNAPPDRPCVVRLTRGDESTNYACEICDQYTIQGDLFAESIINDTPVPTPIDDAVRNMEAIDAVVLSSRTGGWVSLAT